MYAVAVLMYYPGVPPLPLDHLSQRASPPTDSSLSQRTLRYDIDAAFRQAAVDAVVSEQAGWLREQIVEEKSNRHARQGKCCSRGTHRST